MKWATTKKPDTKDKKKSYTHFPDEKSRDSNFKIKRRGNEPSPFPENKNLWVTYEVGPIKEAQQRDYEIFCGGYLHFYDYIVRNRTIDHTLYLEWFEKNGKTWVSIFLSPAPVRKSAEDDQSKTKTSAKSRSVRSEEKESSEADYQSAALARGGFFIDPPLPPPPPPPARD